METMRFSSPQLNVSIYPLDNGMDVVICLNEREVVLKGDSESRAETMYEYDGNVFRTFKLTADEIVKDPGAYIDYKGDAEPTEEMTQYANEMIDAYTEQLILEGVIV